MNESFNDKLMSFAQKRKIINIDNIIADLITIFYKIEKQNMNLNYDTFENITVTKENKVIIKVNINEFRKKYGSSKGIIKKLKLVGINFNHNTNTLSFDIKNPLLPQELKEYVIKAIEPYVQEKEDSRITRSIIYNIFDVFASANFDINKNENAEISYIATSKYLNASHRLVYSDIFSSKYHTNGLLIYTAPSDFIERLLFLNINLDTLKKCLNEYCILTFFVYCKNNYSHETNIAFVYPKNKRSLRYLKNSLINIFANNRYNEDDISIIIPGKEDNYDENAILSLPAYYSPNALSKDELYYKDISEEYSITPSKAIDASLNRIKKAIDEDKQYESIKEIIQNILNSSINAMINKKVKKIYFTTNLLINYTTTKIHGIVEAINDPEYGIIPKLSISMMPIITDKSVANRLKEHISIESESNSEMYIKLNDKIYLDKILFYKDKEAPQIYPYTIRIIDIPPFYYIYKDKYSAFSGDNSENKYYINWPKFTTIFKVREYYIISEMYKELSKIDLKKGNEIENDRCKILLEPNNDEYCSYKITYCMKQMFNGSIDKKFLSQLLNQLGFFEIEFSVLTTSDHLKTAQFNFSTRYIPDKNLLKKYIAETKDIENEDIIRKGITSDTDALPKIRLHIPHK